VVEGYPDSGIPPLSISCEGGKSVEVNAPSVAALCLSIARRAYQAALRKRTGLCRGTNAESPDALAYDYLESAMVAVMFSVSALEAFTNAVIGQSAAIGKKYKAKDSAEVERCCSLDKKLKEVLPDLLDGVDSPADRPLWHEYEAMVILRNDWVVHAKTEWTQKKAGKTWSRYSQEFWNELLGENKPANYPGTAESLIRWYVRDPDCWLARLDVRHEQV
jgi:hypothetical protein